MTGRIRLVNMDPMQKQQTAFQSMSLCEELRAGYLAELFFPVVLVVNLLFSYHKMALVESTFEREKITFHGPTSPVTQLDGSD
jgi:hypothetical protein